MRRATVTLTERTTGQKRTFIRYYPNRDKKKAGKK